MSNKGKNHNKRWLITRLKTSGSKRRHVIDGDYADTRNTKKNRDWNNLPKQEGMSKSFKFYNSKVNYGLLVRFLRRKVGQDWSLVHKEILLRIPTDLMEYRECIRWFVADLVEHREGRLWDRREQKFLVTDDNAPYQWNISAVKEFYVDPDSQLLTRTKE